MTGNEPEHVFDEVQIGQGMKPLAQHGYVIVDRGTLTLLGSQQQTIASAPLASVTAQKVRMTLGQTLSLAVNGERYNLTLGWGRYRFSGAFALPKTIKAMKNNAAMLQELISSGGGAA
jgi:hypothetical protein